jgi:glucose/arabinose dehydrogenase
MNARSLICSSVVGLFCLNLAVGQVRIGTGEVRRLYEQHCLACHGPDLDGGLGGSLLERESWKRVGKDISFIDYVLEGDISVGMPAFEGVLSPAEIRSLEIYIDERRQQAKSEPEFDREGNVYTAGGHSFMLETVVEGLERPWSVAFVPDGSILMTEKKGNLRFFRDGELGEPVAGIPEAWDHGQGGLLEVALHPDYAANGWVYLAYSAAIGERDGATIGMTRVVRGRITDNQWHDEEVIYEADAQANTSSGGHFGSRLAFQDGYVYFSVGDRRERDRAQELDHPFAKIHRLHDDGRVPADNPFVDVPGAVPSTWAYGSRNAQGLDFHPLTGELWSAEHGPRGGDEVNLIERGKNYGWAAITYGMNYSGTPITGRTEAPGMEQPKLQWTPSIAVCGIDFYEGEVFPNWTNDLFAGGLRSNQLHWLEIEAGEIVGDTVILKDEGEVRDVASGPDGHLYLLLNRPGRLVRLVPAAPGEAVIGSLR